MKNRNTDKSFFINLITAILLIAIIITFLNNIVHNAFYQDDSFTTFRYVRNCLSGNGLVFNIGEWVEGYTNFLWVIILCAAGKLGIDYVAFAQLFSVFFGIAILIVVYFISKDIFNTANNSNKIISLIPVILLSLNGGFIYWSVSAMETSLFYFLILSAVFVFNRNYQSNRSGYLFPILILLASLTRPEGLFYGGILIAYETIDKSLKNGIKSILPKVLNNIAVIGSPLLLYFVWKYYYYGELLPNTFYAKTGAGEFYLIRGMKYIYTALNESYYYVIAIVSVFYFLLNITKRKSYQILLVLLFANTINVIIVGGDVLPLNRFLWLSLFVMYAGFSGLMTELLYFVKPKYNFIISIILLFVIATYSLYSFGKQEIKVREWRAFELGLVSKMKIYANWLNDYVIKEKRQPVVALSTIGALSYYSNAKVIDLIGLTDEYIAHHPKEVEGIAGNISVLWKERRYNIDYILSKEPDFIIFPAGLKPSAYPEAALFSKLGFYFNYYPQLIYSDELDLLLPIYTRKTNKLVDKINLSNADCDVNFVEDFIRASNYLLAMNKNNGENILDKVKHYAGKAQKECIARKDFPLVILGTAYFNLNNYTEAEKCFSEAIEWNKLNVPALFYLMQINYKQGNMSEAVRYLSKLKKISPSALPGIIR